MSAVEVTQLEPISQKMQQPQQISGGQVWLAATIMLQQGEHIYGQLKFIMKWAKQFEIKWMPMCHLLRQAAMMPLTEVLLLSLHNKFQVAFGQHSQFESKLLLVSQTHTSVTHSVQQTMLMERNLRLRQKFIIEIAELLNLKQIHLNI